MIKAGGSKYYFATNHLYSVAALTDSTGAVVERYKYDAYGRQGIMNTNGTVSYTPSDYGNFIGFTGRYHDCETGLIYFRARYYDTGLGRFIGRDPLAYVNGSNLYSAYYVPNRLDPSGLATIYDLIPPNLTAFQWFLRQAINACEEWQAKNNPNGGSPPAVGRGKCPTTPNAPNSPNTPVDCQAAALAALKNSGLEKVTPAEWQLFRNQYNQGIQSQLDLEHMNMMVGMVAGGAASLPTTLARVIPNGIEVSSLGVPGAATVYVIDAAAIEGMSAKQIQEGLAIPESSTGYQIITFPAPAEGLASPINRGDPGFVGGGKTAGGLPEYSIPNGPIPPGATTTIVH